MDTLTNLERDVIDKILQPDHPILADLRDQIPYCTVIKRAFTGAGFFTDLDVGNAPRARCGTFEFGDVLAEVDGHETPLGFLLIVEDGRLKMLEGYTFENVWPEDVSKYRLRFDQGEIRNVLSLFGVFMAQAKGRTG